MLVSLGLVGLFIHTCPKREKPCNGVSQDPRVTAELEQVVGENVDKPEAEPADDHDENISFYF